VETGLGLLDGDLTQPYPVGSPVQVLIRPEDVVHDDDSPVQAEVLRRTFRGANVLYTLRLDCGAKVQALVPSHCEHSIGERIGIHTDVRDIVVFAD
jgi:iron(III) transport system ATP-binding protein